MFIFYKYLFLNKKIIKLILKQRFFNQGLGIKPNLQSP